MKFFQILKSYKNIFIRALLLISLFILFLSVSAFSYATVISKNISESVFRLHVIANSDTKEDQELKYKVRDNLLFYMNNICKNVNTKEEAIEIARNNIDEFYNIARKTILNEGYSYPVEVSIEQSNFPTKNYGDISLPSGLYDCLKVKIGNYEGQNWWCVMFPPLCFVDISSGVVPEDSKEELKDSLGDEEFSIINTDSSYNVSYKFKIVELIENMKMKLAQNN